MFVGRGPSETSAPRTAGVSSRLIDAYATEPHYLAHLLPLWNALPPERRGTFWVTRDFLEEGLTLGHPPKALRPVLVASFKDSRAVARVLRPRILLEHGAGQTYIDAPGNGGYSGGDGHDGTILFLTPNETVAERWRRRYPGVPAVAIGSPRLDGFGARFYASFHADSLGDRSSIGQTNASSFGSSSEGEKSEPLTIAISFHWHCSVSPEADWAFPHFKDALPELRDRFELIGHGHPRAWRFLRNHYRSLDIEAVESFDEVLNRASCFVIDNSSAMYETAAVGIPIVAMNSPTYRKYINHGLRFWDSIPGLQCDQPKDLVATVERALDDPPEVRRIREEIARTVYPHLGTAASRGAAAILEVLDH